MPDPILFCSHFRVKFRYMSIFHLFSTFTQKIKLFNKKFKSLAVFWVEDTLPYENSLKVSVDLRCGLCKKIFSWGLYLIKFDIRWFLSKFCAKTRHFCPFFSFFVIYSRHGQNELLYMNLLPSWWATYLRYWAEIFRVCVGLVNLDFRTVCAPK